MLEAMIYKGIIGLIAGLVLFGGAGLICWLWKKLTSALRS
jgi:energy-converting hydrogenase Eha subunit H